ncbi:MAG TPA: ABC transporter substrate-binding protein [Ktedonobacterales bacterium]
MRPNRDGIFVAVLILALVASTSVAIIAATGASLHTTVTIQGGGDLTNSGSGTPSGGGGGSGSPGGSAGGGGVIGGSGSQTQGVSGSTIKIGGIFTESNGLDSRVEEDTVRACFNRVNAQGGVNGRKLQLVSYDDGLSANTAYQEAARLDQQDHVFAIVGWLAPFGEASAAPYFEQHGIPIIGGLGVPQEFGNPYSFPVSPIFQTDGVALGAYATDPAGPLKLKHPGVILVQTAGINTVADGIVQGAKRNGVTISSNSIDYVPFAAPSFDNDLLKFRSQGADGLITQLDPFSYVRLYSSMKSTGGIMKHLAGAGLDKQSVDAAINQSGSTDLVNSYSFMPYLEAQGNPDGDPEVALYNRTVAQYYPSQVANMDAFSEGSWIACRVFVQALQSVGQNVTRGALIQALNSQTFQFGNMVEPLNYGKAGSSHAANHCAVYIAYTSSHTWRTAAKRCY